MSLWNENESKSLYLEKKKKKKNRRAHFSMAGQFLIIVKHFIEQFISRWKTFNSHVI